MSFYLSSQVPVLNNKTKDCIAIMTVFEPVSFDTEEEAKKYSDIFSILKNTSYDVVDSDSIELYYSNLLDYEISCCNP